jgi:putative ABC transport system permease protein
MIKNYFKIAFRGFWKHKLFTLINIVGLSIGISAAVVIYLIVHFDFTFDKFHKDGNRIYRVVTNYSFQGETGYNSGVCGPLTIAMHTQVTGVAAVAPFYTLYEPNVEVPGKDNASAKFKNMDNVVLADPQYFKLFNYTWLAGSAQSSLSGPNQLVVTSDQAKKYFPNLSYNQMIGKTVIYDTLKTTVSGIVQTLTQNSDLTFHDFISYATVYSNKDMKDDLQLDQWTNTSSASQLFIKLSPQTSPAHIEAQINALLNQHSKETKGNSQDFHLQALSDLHFNAQYGSFDGGSTVSKTMLYGLLGIAAFLLLLGCINFINLTTAQATQRAKEIGIRKTMGSSRQQLVFQFLSETFLITLIAVIISAGLTPLILKLFSGFIPAGVKADFIGQPNLILFLIVLTVGVSLLSGFYPAILLSGYKPVLVLKNQASSNSSKTRTAYLRKSLTVTQFIIAQFFIMATILVSKQIYYALHKDLGFKKDAILVLNSPWKTRQTGQNQVFLNKLRSIPQIAMISLGGNSPSSGNTQSTAATYQDGKHEIKTQIEEKYGDENYVKVYGIKILAGRNLRQSDTSSGFLINETYAKILGFKLPMDALGKMIQYNGNGKKMQVIGVVRDFYQKSLHTPIKPMVIVTAHSYYQTGIFHIALRPETPDGNQWKKAITLMNVYWKEVYPDDDFDYQFYDESIAKFYDTEQHTSTLLTWATGLSIFISCLGLLGLAIYTTNQRTKEIGVRKVLGASVTQIVTLLSTEMVLLILLAFIIVSPLAWYAMNKWMQNFADRTAISWWIFAASGAGMLLTAIFTSSFQTVKAAIANPVRSLRSE